VAAVLVIRVVIFVPLGASVRALRDKLY
jgi:hypothetical protein